MSKPELPAANPLVLRDNSQTGTALAPGSEHDSAELLARYRLIIENISDVVLTALPDGTIDWVSPSIEDLLGWTRDEFVGRTFYDMLHPDDQLEVAALQTKIKDGRAATTQARVRSSDGNYRWISSRVKLVRNSAGEIIGRVATWSDGNEQVETRQELESLTKAMLDPHVVIAPIRDKNGKIFDFEFLDANTPACAFNVTSRDEIVGSSIMGQLPNHRPSELLPMYVAIMETGEPLILNDVAYVLGNQGIERRVDVRGVKVGERISITWRDVTDRYERTKATQVSEEHYRLLSANSTNVVIKIQDGVVTFVSPSISEVLGWAPEEWLGHRTSEFAHPDDLLILAASTPSGEQGGNTVARFRLRSKNGDYHWLEDLSRPFLNAAGQQDGRIASMHLIDREVATEKDLLLRASRDPVTGLLSRTEVLRKLGATLKHELRTGQQTAVVFCDVDHFKAVNDRFGHAAGDQVLKTIGTRIQELLRSVDLVSRFGGDEILVVLDGVRDQANSIAIAEKIKEVAMKPIQISGQSLIVTLSIGLTLKTATDTTETIIARADTAMYQAKKTGRNRVSMI